MAAPAEPSDATPTVALPAGVSIEIRDQIRVVVIELLGNELKQHIRNYLIAVCRGSAAAEGVPAWDYRSTVKALNTRVQGKDRNGRVGMVGELLTHVLAPLLLPHLSQAAVFFNKEDRSVKKGFDLTFLEEGASRVWYAEVKSGEPSGAETPAAKAATLLKTAAADLIGKLTGNYRDSLWDAAINDAMLTLRDPQVTSAKQLLSKDSTNAADSSTWDKHAILTAGVFSDVAQAKIDVAAIGTSLTLTDKLDAGFHEELWIVIQKSTFDAVVDFVATEAAE